ncbi:hypothetical protein AVEN_157664-1 [Araneus ventricosus]|uniref:Uncharacterized protein n=1 Tax=Araneus ventricosus TaxID=182803 RepID=A0A4Y2CLC9_ARAVE|nr:hypothetical protein AVEN_157664-1 [Araneus ventricosus]
MTPCRSNNSTSPLPSSLHSCLAEAPIQSISGGRLHCLHLSHRWPCGKVSASSPEGSSLETRFHRRSAVLVSLLQVKSGMVSQTSSLWYGGEAWRCQIRCRPRDLTMIQNDEARPKIALVLLQNGTLL